MQGAPARQAHGRVALDVVPDQAHRLLERPRLAALPLEVVTPKLVAQHLPRARFEQMPGSYQVERRIRGPEATDIDDPAKAPIGDEQVSRDQVTVVHQVAGRTAWQCPQVTPHSAQPRNVKKRFAALKAGLHPLVVGTQVATPTLPAEVLAVCID